jgi:hypothetical protein
MPDPVSQLISYIAPAAPATRRPATGDEPFLRPEIGYTPAWYRQHLKIDFGERFHTDLKYRREAVVAMHELLRNEFAGGRIGCTGLRDTPLDLLTGVFGACSIAAIYGIPIVYATDTRHDMERGSHHIDGRVARPERRIDLRACRRWPSAAEHPAQRQCDCRVEMNNTSRPKGSTSDDRTGEMTDEAVSYRHIDACPTAIMDPPQ